MKNQFIVQCVLPCFLLHINEGGAFCSQSVNLRRRQTFAFFRRRDFFRYHNNLIRAKATLSSLDSYKRDEDGGHSFVEGEIFESEFDEVSAMGGDPFFLSIEDDDENGNDDGNEDVRESLDTIQTKEVQSLLSEGPMNILKQMKADPIEKIPLPHNDESSKSSEEDKNKILEMGGDPFFLDDNLEEMHIDGDNLTKGDYEQVENTSKSPSEEKSSISPVSILEELAGMSFGGTTGLLNQFDTPNIQPSLSKANVFETDSQIDEIEAMGGDPSFLDLSWDQNENNHMDDNNHDEILATGGDPWFLEKETISSQSDSNNALEEENGPSALEILSQLSTLSKQKESHKNEDSIDGKKVQNSEISEVSYEDLEASGGDPFFLEAIDLVSEGSSLKDEMSSASRPSKVSSGRYVTDGQGPSSKLKQKTEEGEDWIWDGSVDEDAHFDLE